MLKQKSIVKQNTLSEEELQKAISEAMEGVSLDQMATIYEESIKDFEPEKIVKGRVLNISSDSVIVDVGYKSEGEVPLSEFDEPPKNGEEIEEIGRAHV